MSYAYSTPTGLAATSGVPAGCYNLSWNPSVSSGASLLLTFDGTAGSTSITDSSANANVMTVLGSATVQTSSPQFGTGYGHFTDYNGSGWSTPMSSGSPLDLHHTDFTVECWLRTTNTSVRGQIFSDLILGLPNSLRGESFNGSTIFQAQYNGGGAGADAYGPSSVNTADGNWHHCVFSATSPNGTSSSGSAVGCAVDGQWGSIVQNVYAYDSDTTANTSFQIGFDGLSAIQGGGLVADLDEMRVTRSVVYPIGTNFTPPTQPFSLAPPGYDVYRDGVSIGTYVGASTVYHDCPNAGPHYYQVAAWDPSLGDVSAESSEVAVSTLLKSYGKFAGVKAYPPTLLIDAKGLKPRIYMPHENTTVQKP